MDIQDLKKSLYTLTTAMCEVEYKICPVLTSQHRQGYNTENNKQMYA